MKKRFGFGLVSSVVVGLAVLASPSIADANHSWGGYHWARTANPFTLQVESDVSSVWTSYLNTALSDWSKSNVLDMTKVDLAGAKPNCPAISGKDRVCNRAYGYNGWLGVAQIWITDGTHIVAGTVKLNDSYFNTSTYNSPAWRQMVACQEVGHTLGLDHQDENFNNTNLGTCMDYTSNPLGPPDNEHPNQHDYDELAIIYNHLDSSTTLASATGGGGPGRGNGNGQGDVFAPDFDGVPAGAGPQNGDVFVTDFGNGKRVITHVFWVRPGNPEP